jgi:hypothetical protein
LARRKNCQEFSKSSITSLAWPERPTRAMPGLFAGAGTVRAAPFVSYMNDLIGTIAHKGDPSNPPGAIEFCNYHSNVAGQPFAFPFDAPV